MPKEIDGNVINFGKLKKIAKAMATKYTIKLGLLAEQGGSDSVSEDLDLAGLGVIQEYGADIKITPKMAAFLALKARELGLPKKEQKGDGYVHIPARSFLYEPIVGDSKGFKKEINKEIDEFAIEYIAEYEDFEILAKIIAIAGFNRIIKAFNDGGINGEWPSNSPFTIAGKKSDKPLINTSYLKNRITYKVEKNVQ